MRYSFRDYVDYVAHLVIRVGFRFAFCRHLPRELSQGDAGTAFAFRRLHFCQLNLYRTFVMYSCVLFLHPHVVSDAYDAKPNIAYEWWSRALPWIGCCDPGLRTCGH